jgi:FkbM family methyltransferase
LDTLEIQLAFRLRKYARENRSSSIVRYLVSKSERFLQGYYNQDYFDLDKNGEARVIEAVVAAQSKTHLFVLDVGANRGEWAKAVLERQSDATIFCFEIIPPIAAALRTALANYPNVHVFDFGLSSASMQVDVCWNHTWDTANSIVPRLEDRFFSEAKVSTLPCEVRVADAVLEDLRLERIDLLKIDVEGHEMEVLAGFAKTLQSNTLRPRVIQFEYGATWLPPRHNLREAYRMLEPLGYVIGRLFPDGVEFKSYEFADDHFRMGNYIAAQAQDPLVKRFARF